MKNIKDCGCSEVQQCSCQEILFDISVADNSFLDIVFLQITGIGSVVETCGWNLPILPVRSLVKVILDYDYDVLLHSPVPSLSIFRAGAHKMEASCFFITLECTDESTRPQNPAERRRLAPP